ncbi:hypothetical protein RN001_007213 [Aquatica leii]|uniref:Peptidase S59 domain-containing protein n=1 Tax=Aquatica leii TaxID=1421715 RepID=A0AAN7PXX4_9COLE|nr:hypothetical protein RN001_007213 [Aquatica leii]
MTSYQPFTQNRNFLNLYINDNAFLGQHSCAQVQGASVPYNPATERSRFASPFADKFGCIADMDVNKNKSLEEIRWEDYQRNQKGPTLSLQNTSLKPMMQQPQFLRSINFVERPTFDPILKPAKPSFSLELMPLSTNKSMYNFNLPPSNNQTNFSGKIKYDPFSLTSLPKSAQPTQPNLQPSLPAPSQLTNASNTNPNTNTYALKVLPQPPKDEFYNNVKQIFQPFPRRDFLVDVGSNFDMQNRTTDPDAINEILNELRAPDINKPNLSFYSPCFIDSVKQSFFEDVTKHVPVSTPNRSLVLKKTHQENEFLPNLQITVVKSININYTTTENHNPKVDEDLDLSHCQNCIELKPIEENLGESLKHIKLKLNVDKGTDAVSGLSLNPNSCKITQTTDTNVAEKETQASYDTLQIGDCKNIKSCHVKLTKTDYYTEPPFEDLHKYVQADCNVKDFVIGRKGYGKIHFLDLVNLYNLNLDEIVDIDYRNVTVYPDDGKKPPLGEGLNVKAEITIDGIWPLDKTNDTMITDVEKITKTNFIDKLKRLAEKQNASFVNYLPDTGSWIFQVEHF